MPHLFLDFFQSNFEVFRNFGYYIVFLVTFLESVPLFGMIIPGQTIILLSGFLVKIKLFGFWLAVSAGAIGAFIGDLTGFLIGKKYGKHFTEAEQKFYIKREQFLKIKNLIMENPFKSIFFGRLHSLSRTLTPFASGASGISLKKFIFIDVFSCFTWAFISVLIGFVFGKSFERASFFIGSFITTATVVTILIIAMASYAKKKNVPISRKDVWLMTSSALSLYLFALVAENLHRGQVFSILDTRILSLYDSLYSPFLTFIMIVFTSLGTSSFMIFISVILVAYLLSKKRIRDAIMSAIILGTGYGFVEILKLYFNRPRPEGLIDVYGHSFPSGHATMSMMFAVMITYLVIRSMRSVAQKNILTGVVFITSIAIGISRIYLNVHFASDVLAGFLFGIFWATFGIVLFRAGRFLIKVAKKRHEIPLP